MATDGTEPKIEEIDSDSDDEVNDSAPGSVKCNRAEKKSRRALIKMGYRPFFNGTPEGTAGIEGVLKPTSKVVRVSVKKQKNILFVIQQPDVYRLGTESVVIIGQARIEDVSQSANALRQMGGMGGMGPSALSQMAKNMDPSALASAAAALGGPAPESSESPVGSPKGKKGKKSEADAADVNVEEKDVELVVTQVGCSRDKAVAALKANKNDIVEAIMSFNM